MFALIIFIVLLLSIATYGLRNYLAVSPAIPGPVLARFTDFWRAYKQYNGQLRCELVKLHAEHGQMVRYGVKSISVSDPTAIDIIYGSRAGFVTAESYNVLIGISNGKEVPSLVSTRDEQRHGQLRRSVASAFTVRGAQDYEHFVDTTISDLVDVLSESDGRTIDLSNLFMLYSMDSAARMAFSESLGCLKSGSDIDGSIELIRDRFRHWGWWSSVPWLERLVYRNPIAMQRTKGKTPSAIVKTAASKLRRRMDEKNQESHDMLSKFVASHETGSGALDAQGIISLLMSTISGAGDTTATTMTAIMYFLVKHPVELEKLRTELIEAGMSRNDTCTFTITNKLPYLAAVIKESMRLFPAPTWPIERLVPAGGCTIAGQHIPEGTSVGVFLPSLHLSKEVFGADAESFRPQRWIDAKEGNLKSMEQAFMGFSRGKRVCLGQNVALMQMKKVVAVLVMGFDIEFVQPDARLEGDMSLAVACLEPLWVTVKLRHEI